MLILSRKLGEVIVIDKNISIAILNIGSNRVRLGINAPKAVSVDRDKLQTFSAKKKFSEDNSTAYQSIEAENPPSNQTKNK